MDAKRDALIRRAAELTDRSLRMCSAAAELKTESEGLVRRLAQTQRAGARIVKRLRGPGPAPYTPGTIRRRPGTDDGAASVRAQPQTPAPGAGSLYPVLQEADMLGKDEAVSLAALLEELAARDRLDPLSAPALQAAALLRRRAAAAQGRGVRPGPAGPAARREAGDTRDDDADNRDTEAGQRDRWADERDETAKERDGRADDADQGVMAGEQRVSDLLWAAELRDKAAAEHAAAPPPADDGALRQQWQLDRERTQADRARNREDREAIRELLSETRVARQAARHDRYADVRDRLASHRDRSAAHADREDAARDRRAASADRDQAVIENEEEEVPRD
jgi:hypothetical protein